MGAAESFEGETFAALVVRVLHELQDSLSILLHEVQ